MSSGLLGRIGRGYARLGRSVLAVLALLGASLASGLIIVFPLWYLATRHRELYGLAILLLTTVVIGWLILRRAARTLKEYPSLRAYAAGVLIPFAGRAASALAVLAAVYIDLLLYGRGLPAPALIGSLAIAFLLGWLLFGRTSAPRERK